MVGHDLTPLLARKLNPGFRRPSGVDMDDPDLRAVERLGERPQGSFKLFLARHDSATARAANASAMAV